MKINKLFNDVVLRTGDKNRFRHRILYVLR